MIIKTKTIMGWKHASRIIIKKYTGFIYKHSVKIKTYITKGRCLFHYMIKRLHDTVREEMEPVKNKGLEKKNPSRKRWLSWQTV